MSNGKNKINETLLENKVGEYSNQYESYKAYARLLREVLEKACRRLAPLSIIETRAKSTASLAEKVVRKQWKFENVAGYDLTDRCGARVVTSTLREKDLVCDYIKKNFLVDEANSLDKRAELKTDQFGYLSVHYVVQIKEGIQRLEGVNIPEGVLTGRTGFKAEIQVRTFLEHAWASALHDRLYKGTVQVPKSLQRDAAGLAAMIETTDAKVMGLADSIDGYLGYYSAYMSKPKIEEEIQILGAARRAEKDEKGKAALTLKIARLHMQIDHYDGAITELEAEADCESPSKTAIQMELGWALCWRSRKNLNDPEFKRGQNLLKKVAGYEPLPAETVVPADVALRAEAAHRLAWSHSLRPGEESLARKQYRRAHELDTSNPYHLSGFLEYEVCCTKAGEFVRVMRLTVEAAIAKCRSHIAVGIEIPRAYFTIGRLYILLKDYSKALDAYLDSLRVVLAPLSSCPECVFDDELEFLKRITVGQEAPPEHKWFELLLTLAKAVRLERDAKPFSLADFASEAVETIKNSGKKTVFILAGGAGFMNVEELEQYKGFILIALKNAEGLVCSGGTQVGIPGLAGEAAEALKKSHEKNFILFSYLPKRGSLDALPDKQRYDHIFRTDGNNFSVWESLQGWIDCIHAGILPQQVRVLGINGGPIASFEYRLALALGARVGIIVKSGRAADAILQDAEWGSHPGLIRLPLGLMQQDAATVRAFMRPAALEIDKTKLEELAGLFHEKYLSENKYSSVDPLLRRYKDLQDGFKESNRQAALYAAEILATEGYVIRKFGGKADEKIPMPDFSKDEIERMAELEHGRWNLERLGDGWKYGAKKDVENKINPYLVPWTQLSDGDGGVKKFDRLNVTSYAEILAKAGYVIVKSSKT